MTYDLKTQNGDQEPVNGIGNEMEISSSAGNGHEIDLGFDLSVLQMNLNVPRVAT